MAIDFMTLSVILLSLGVVFVLTQSLVGSGRRRMWDRLDEDGPSEVRFRKNVALPRRGRFADDIATSLAAQIPQPVVEAEQLASELMRAGYYRPTARRNFLAIRNACTVLPLVVAAALLVIFVPTTYVSAVMIALGLMAAGLGYSLPRFRLRWQGNRRVQRIERSLPDAVDMLTMCVTGGMTMNEALDRVSRELGMSHEDLALELAILRRHAELGSLVQGLQQFSRRIATAEVQSLTTLLIQSERLGTDLVRSLEAYADNLRRRRRQLAEERANRASVKMLFPLVLCLAPSVFILLLGPAVLELRSFLVRERQPGGVLSQENIETVRAFPTINDAGR